MSNFNRGVGETLQPDIQIINDPDQIDLDLVDDFDDDREVIAGVNVSKGDLTIPPGPQLKVVEQSDNPEELKGLEIL